VSREALRGARRYFADDLLAGQVAVVTGGSAGIGLAIACAFAELGADVAIASRSRERLAEAASRLAAATGRLCSTFVCDVRDEAVVEALRDQVGQRYGDATIVVNNAAANFRMAAERMTGRALQTVVDIDLVGTFNVTRAFVGAMIESGGGGAILNVVVPEAERGFPEFSHSGAAKAGIVSLTRSWAREWGRHGIRVNALAPGPVPTEGVASNMLGGASAEDTFADRLAKVALGRLGTPGDIAAAAAFLCSPAACWITGICLNVDGGMNIA
jgi:NAD(P)-dependent dehydrogenase (short-subunit alcohol dehydrogenase family)